MAGCEDRDESPRGDDGAGQDWRRSGAGRGEAQDDGRKTWTGAGRGCARGEDRHGARIDSGRARVRVGGGTRRGRPRRGRRPWADRVVTVSSRASATHETSGTGLHGAGAAGVGPSVPRQPESRRGAAGLGGREVCAGVAGDPYRFCCRPRGSDECFHSERPTSAGVAGHVSTGSHGSPPRLETLRGKTNATRRPTHTDRWTGADPRVTTARRPSRDCPRPRALVAPTTGLGSRHPQGSHQQGSWFRPQDFVCPVEKAPSTPASPPLGSFGAHRAQTTKTSSATSGPKEKILK